MCRLFLSFVFPFLLTVPVALASDPPNILDGNHLEVADLTWPPNNLDSAKNRNLVKVVSSIQSCEDGKAQATRYKSCRMKLEAVFERALHSPKLLAFDSLIASWAATNLQFLGKESAARDMLASVNVHQLAQEKANAAYDAFLHSSPSEDQPETANYAKDQARRKVYLDAGPLYADYARMAESKMKSDLPHKSFMDNLTDLADAYNASRGLPTPSKPVDTDTASEPTSEQSPPSQNSSTTAAAPPEPAGGCSPTLAYLEKVIPAVDEANLMKTRDTILGTRFADVISQIQAQGLTLQQALEQTVKQEAIFRDAMDQSEKCIRAAIDTPENADSTMSRLKLRDYTGLVLAPTDILGSCINSFVLNDWARLANSESAVQLGCNMGGK